MSYCRWSSDRFRCDVYVYADVMGGWTTHVASNRIVGDIPQSGVEMMMLNLDNPPTEDTFTAAQKAYHEALNEVTRVEIDLPHAGESFNHKTPGECADNLEELRRLGYVVPQYAIDDLRNEQKEMTEARGDVYTLQYTLGEEES